MDFFNGTFHGSKRPALQAPESYESAQTAMDAVLAFTRNKGRYEQVPINWEAAEEVLSGELESLCLSDAVFSNLYRALKAIGFSANALRNQIVKYGYAHWNELSGTIRSLAMGYIPDRDTGIFCTQFLNVIQDFPELADDDEIFDHFIDSIERKRTNLETSISQIRVLNGDEKRAARVLRAIGAAGHHSANHQFALLCAKWAGGSVYGKLQYALWYAPPKHDRDEIVVNISIPCQVKKLASLLGEFGLGAKVGQNHYNLSSLPSVAKDSWREELATVVKGDSELEAATLETLLVMGPVGQDQELLSAVIKLVDKKAKDGLVAFIGPETTLANRRARACMSMMHGSPDVLDLMIDAYQSSVAKTVSAEGALPRTWLGDARVEQLFECSVNDMARRVGDEVFDNLHAGEETHVAELFKELKFCLEKLSSQLAFAANELDARERFDFSLSQRIIGKPEEGGASVDHPRFSTDVCLIFKAMDDGVCLSQRVTLIQAKRLQVITGRPFVYSLKRDQLNDIATQTLASFLLLLGPAHGSSCLPVLPAGLMVDLMKQNGSMSLSPSRAAGLGRNFGTWLLEDVIGLWTGDKMGKLVEKALGEENRRPRLIFELVVQRQSKRSDG